MRCASLAVGVVDYRHAYYREEMRLNYAVSDAQAFHTYTCQAWPQSLENHIVLADQAATLQGIGHAVDAIAQAPPLDLFFLYLSGHGEVGNEQGGWFCLYDAQPGTPSLNAQALSILLGKINADYVLVFIDCCHAEAVVSGERFLRAGASFQAGVLIASARVNQKAWEVDSLQRSIFSDVLLRGLSTGTDLADAQGQVDVEGKLIPYLRQQVPLAASALKRGAEQTIVTQVFLANSISLPVISSRSLGRPLTIRETIRGGIRRILIAAACTAVVSLVAIDVLIYHFAVDSNGKLLVLPGFVSTYNLLPVHLTRQVDTGLTVFDVNDRDDAFLASLSNGSSWGIATHRDAAGLKPWLAKLIPSLESNKANELRAFTQSSLLVVDPDQYEPPKRAVYFLSRALQRAVPDVGAQAYPVTWTQDTPCQEPIDNVFNFTVLNPSSMVFSRDMDWVARTTTQAPAAQAIMLDNLIKLAAYRTFNEDDYDERRTEFERFVAVVSRLSQLPGRTMVFDELSGRLEAMQGTWCALHAALVKGLLGREADSVAAEAQMLAVYNAYDRSTQGYLLSTAQLSAIASLGEMAKRRPLSPTTTVSARQMAEKDGESVMASKAAVALLLSIAAHQTLEPGTRDALFGELTLPADTVSYEGGLAAVILSRNYKHLDGAHKDQLRSWLEAVAVEQKLDENIHEALGFLAMNETLPAPIIDMLVSRLSAVSRFPFVATDYRGTDIISINGDAAAVALGKVAQVNHLDDDIVERLASVASRRPDLKDREEIVSGLARQWYEGGSDVVTTLIDRLSAAQGDSVRRLLEVEVGAHQLSASPEQQLPAQLERLLQQWKSEAEPAQKIALAQVLGSIER